MISPLPGGSPSMNSTQLTQATMALKMKISWSGWELQRFQRSENFTGVSIILRKDLLVDFSGETTSWLCIIVSFFGISLKKYQWRILIYSVFCEAIWRNKTNDFVNHFTSGWQKPILGYCLYSGWICVPSARSLVPANPHQVWKEVR